jgi:hypothetical protein
MNELKQTKVFVFIRNYLKIVHNKYLFFKWTRSKYKKPNTHPFVCHLLVVKKPIYVLMAKICILSFLYYHPNSTILVHCDHSTFLLLNKMLSAKIRSGKVQLILDKYAGVGTWQAQKIDLLLKLNGTEHIFMDADLKWNGALSDLGGTTFFVREFQITSSKVYARFLSHSKNKVKTEIYMWNTSFFTFGGNYEPNFIVNQINLINSQVLETISRIEPEDLKASIFRISEQLVISLSTKNWVHPINSLKKVDGHKDGQYVESSYFGATGSTF